MEPKQAETLVLQALQFSTAAEFVEADIQAKLPEDWTIDVRKQGIILTCKFQQLMPDGAPTSSGVVPHFTITKAAP